MSFRDRYSVREPFREHPRMLQAVAVRPPRVLEDDPDRVCDWRRIRHRPPGDRCTDCTGILRQRLRILTLGEGEPGTGARAVAGSRLPPAVSGAERSPLACFRVVLCGDG